MCWVACINAKSDQVGSQRSVVLVNVTDALETEERGRILDNSGTALVLCVTGFGSALPYQGREGHFRFSCAFSNVYLSEDRGGDDCV
jgi:hypothetical protein